MTAAVEPGPTRTPLSPAAAGMPDVPLPPPGAALRRILAHPRFLPTNRLVATVLTANVVVLVIGVASGWWNPTGIRIDILAAVAQANFAVAVLIRQQFFLNALSAVVMRAPHTWPLSIRRTLSKTYQLGGIHAGAAASGTFWFAGLLGSMIVETVAHATVSIATIAVAAVLCTVLFSMASTAVPKRRASHHDLFEKVHRFGGWSVVGLFWTFTVLLAADRAGDAGLGASLLATPSFWVLCVTTLSSLVPWLLLRRIRVDISSPSSHVAIVRSGYGRPIAGTTRAVSRHPLGQWHSFATVPKAGVPGFRLVISRAGDWTADFIDSPPSHLWVRGVATAGMANYGALFTKVVYVATGSGIGPVLAHLLAARTPMRLVWVTRNPVRTYGQGLVDEIMAAQPDALIWDTDALGKPDLVRLAYSVYADAGAEAVICISNKKLTWHVMHGLEALDVPCMGPVWDS